MIKKKEEEGAAMIIALLTLMIFTAISLNMFFVSQQKAKRAGEKAKGNRSLSIIDSGTNLGYFEIRSASRYFQGIFEGEAIIGSTELSSTPGVLFLGGFPGGVNVSNGALYIPDDNLSAPINPKFAGTTSSFIKLGQLTEFFNSYENGVNTSRISATAIGVSATAIGIVEPASIRKMWDDPAGSRSIGGYVIDTDETRYDRDEFGGFPGGGTLYKNIAGINTNPGGVYNNVHTQYIKRIRVQGDDALGIKPIDFVIRYAENISVSNHIMTLGNMDHLTVTATNSAIN